MKILLKWLLSAAALLCVAYIYSGVQVQSFGSALIAAFAPLAPARPRAYIWAKTKKEPTPCPSKPRISKR